MSKNILAYVLCDVPAHGLKAGQLLEASDKLVKDLEKVGSVDPHKEAVAAARQARAPIVRSSIEHAAEQASARRKTLQVEIAKAEAALKDATEESIKAALQADIEQNQAELASLS